MSIRRLVFKALVVFIAVALVMGINRDDDKFDDIRRHQRLATVTSITYLTPDALEMRRAARDGRPALLRYRTDDGREISSRRFLPKSVRNDHQAGKTIRLYYDPRDPQRIVFEGQGAAWGLMTLCLIVLLVLFVVI